MKSLTSLVQGLSIPSSVSGSVSVPLNPPIPSFETSSTAKPQPRRYVPLRNMYTTKNIDLYDVIEECVGMAIRQNYTYERVVKDANHDQIYNIGDMLEKEGIKAQDILHQPLWDMNSIARLYKEIRAYNAYFGFKYSNISDGLLAQLKRVHDADYVARYFADEYVARLFVSRLSVDFTDPLTIQVVSPSYIYSILQIFKLSNFTCLLDSILKPDENCLAPPSPGDSMVMQKGKKDGKSYYRILYNSKPITFCDNQDSDGFGDLNGNTLQEMLKSRSLATKNDSFCQPRHKLKVDRDILIWGLIILGGIACLLVFCIFVYSLTGLRDNKTKDHSD